MTVNDTNLWLDRELPQIQDIYKRLESRVEAILQVIPPTLENQSAWSPEFRSIIVDITSEFDSIMKGVFYRIFWAGELPPELIKK